MRILFDLDGTLTDPFLGITSCIQYALEKLDQPVPEKEDLAWCIGPPLHEGFKELLGTNDMERATEAVQISREYFSSKGLYENEVYAGVLEMLTELGEAGFEMSIATSKPRVFAEKIIDHFSLQDFFCAVDGSELDGTRRDKTSLIRYILDRDQLDPTQVLMIGDRKYDILGAAANGVRGIGVLWGYGSAEELEVTDAITCAKSPVDLARLILKVTQE